MFSSRERGFWKALSLCLIVALQSPTAFCADQSDSDSLKQAEEAFDRGEYKTGRSLLETLASKGNTKAQCRLGVMYELGQGVEVDNSKALDYYKMAAHKSAGPRLAVHLEGTIKIKNQKEALADLEELAGNGYAGAQNDLGVLYLRGEDVKADYAKAKKYFELSAAQKNSVGQTNLAFMYQHGAGVPQNYAKAIELYSAADGNSVADNNLGFMYARGLGTPVDLVKAKSYFTRAADHGNIDAISNLGWMYQKGQGAQQDFQKAVQMYSKAAAFGLPAARYNLGYMYQTGKGVEQSYKKASDLYKIALMEGTPAAESDLGFMYENGTGVPKDFKTALKYYRERAQERSRLDMQMDVMETVSP